MLPCSSEQYLFLYFTDSMAAKTMYRDGTCCDATKENMKLRRANKKLQNAVTQLGEQIDCHHG